MNDNTRRLLARIGLWACLAVAAVGSLTAVVILIGKSISADRLKTRLIDDYLTIQSQTGDRGDALKRDYMDKCLLARQVYQYHWYGQVDTKMGKLNLKKYYAMSLQEYNDVVELSWKANRWLGLPKDSPENYYMLGKWILESGICPWIEHDTGEVLKLTGYTRDGMRAALYVYRYIMCIRPGHFLYIPELDRPGMSEDELIKVLNVAQNAVKLDYVYIGYLLQYYHYKWDWVLTSFHFGDSKTSYWKEAGLTEIPNYRLDGKWSAEWMRKYYQTVFEIAQGVAVGRMERISLWEKVVGDFQKQNEAERKYMSTLRIKLRSEEMCQRLEEKLGDVNQSFQSYKKLNMELLDSIAKLNDLTFTGGYGVTEQWKAQIRQLKAGVMEKYKRLTGGHKTGITNVLFRGNP